jgi:hypothetical protein
MCCLLYPYDEGSGGGVVCSHSFALAACLCCAMFCFEIPNQPTNVISFYLLVQTAQISTAELQLYLNHHRYLNTSSTRTAGALRLSSRRQSLKLHNHNPHTQLPHNKRLKHHPPTNSTCNPPNHHLLQLLLAAGAVHQKTVYRNISAPTLPNLELRVVSIVS